MSAIQILHYVILTYFFNLIGYANPARILLLPIPMGSHLSWMVELASHLAHRGHQVDMLAPDCDFVHKYVKTPAYTLLLFEYNSCGDFLREIEDRTNDMAQDTLNGRTSIFNILNSIIKVQAAFVTFGESFWEKNARELDLANKYFDIAIVDGVPFNQYNMLIPYKYDIPFVSISTKYDSANMGIPALASFVPSSLSSSSDKMTFFQHLTNFISPQIFVAKFIQPNFLIQKYAPEKPAITFDEIKRKASVHFVDLAPPIDYPRPTLPHVQIIPALGMKEAKPIEDQDLANFVDEADNGFILFSLGSYVSTMPIVLSTKFFEAFSRLNLRVVWRYTGEKPADIPDNVRLVSWLPQNDLLGHRNVKLFMTHCGNNGQFESLFHGVPMLGLPLFGDQLHNAARISHMGYGLSLQVSTLSSDALVKAIKDITNNTTYAERVQLASRILKDDPMKPLEKVTYWAEHVIKFGSHHLRSPAIDMPWYQFWMVDVIVFLLSVLVVIFLLFISLAKLALGFISSNLSKHKHE